MKRNALILLLVAFILGMFKEVAAQRPVQRRNNYGNTQQQQPSSYGNPDTTIKSNNNNNAAPNTYGNNSTASSGIDTALPITVIKSSGNGLLDTVKMSLRNDGAVERNLVKERTPLRYEDIREDDAVFMVRVWREIDAREKVNLPFRYAANTDNGNQRFISILLKAIKDGDVTAFSGDDDRFTTPITAMTRLMHLEVDSIP